MVVDEYITYGFMQNVVFSVKLYDLEISKKTIKSNIYVYTGVQPTID